MRRVCHICGDVDDEVFGKHIPINLWICFECIQENEQKYREAK